MLKIALPENPHPSSLQPKLVSWYSYAHADHKEDGGDTNEAQWIEKEVQDELSRKHDAMDVYVHEMSGKTWSLLDKSRLFASPFETCSKQSLSRTSDEIPKDARRAFRMANLDLALGTVDSMIDTRRVMVDLCGAPGGCVEYFLWAATKRNRPSLVVRGMTTGSGNEDYKITNRGFKSIQADIYDQKETIEFLQKVVNEVGEADIVMSDGSFPHKHESRSWLHLTNVCSTGIRCLREGGQLRVKIFDMMGDRTNQLIWLFSTCFQRLGIIHLGQSRPMSSERYLVFDGFKGMSDHCRSAIDKAERLSRDHLHPEERNWTIPHSYISFVRSVNTERATRQIRYLEIQDLVCRKLMEKIKGRLATRYRFATDRGSIETVELNQVALAWVEALRSIHD